MPRACVIVNLLQKPRSVRKFLVRTLCDPYPRAAPDEDVVFVLNGDVTASAVDSFMEVLCFDSLRHYICILHLSLQCESLTCLIASRICEKMAKSDLDLASVIVRA
jgi:hypothetical protein